ncbi:MAG: MarR family transcriptional regulator [Actinomycetota bacterium]|nr:MarR family transcriptional regulator [Actinomycetota bacterium]
MVRKGPADEVERAMAAIRRQQRRRQLARAAGLEPSSPQAEVFLVLDTAEQAAAAGTELSVSAVAAALSVDLPRASRLIARAVAEGYLQRHSDPTDGRRSLLRLTGHGAKALESMHDSRRQLMARAMAGWSAEEQRQFARLLTRFVGGLGHA